MLAVDFWVAAALSVFIGVGMLVAKRGVGHIYYMPYQATVSPGPSCFHCSTNSRLPTAEELDLTSEMLSPCNCSRNRMLDYRAAARVRP